MEHETVYDVFIRVAKEAAIEVWGRDVWDRLGRDQKHELIMMACEDGIKQAEERAENGSDKD